MKTKSGKHTNLFKRLCLSAAVALLCALFTLAAAATDGSSSASGKTYVHDLAGLLSDSERASVEAKLKDVSSRTGIDVGLLTDDDYTSDYAAQDRADLFAEQNFSEDNVLLFIDLSPDRTDRYWHISTSGLGITVLTDSGIDEIFDELEAKSYGGYTSQISAFASKVSEFTDYYRENGEPYEPGVDRALHPVRKGIFSAVIGFFSSLIATGNMKSKLKSVSSAVNAERYKAVNSLNVSGANELFLYSNVTRAPIVVSTSTGRSGGGSSTHHSSSGHTHGGGGRHF